MTERTEPLGGDQTKLSGPSPAEDKYESYWIVERKK